VLTPPHPNIDSRASGIEPPGLGATDPISYPLALTKAQSQATPYFYIWTTRGTRTVVGKYTGTSTIWFEGADDTEALRRINAHEGERSALGKPVH
jgi:hypothetical protein